MISCACLLSLFVLCTRVDADAEVSCVFMESCILPCSFQGGSDVVIHWMLVGGEATVHSYYDNQDQLARQDQRFRHRTSLFEDQISSGNASLQLTGVKVQDQDRYKCFTSTIRGNKNLFIDLKVDAPVRKVHIEQIETRITCSSEGIYPEPKLTWSTDPPSNQTLQTSPTVQQTEQQLYSISSSLNVTDNVTDLVYTCTVSTRRNQRRTTLFKPASIISSDSETTISCTSTNKTLTDLVWRFNRQTILTRTRTDDTFRVSEVWRWWVKDVSESGSLTLQDLSTDQEGTYTCELSDEEETIKSPENSHFVRGIIVGVVGAILIAVIIGLVFYKKNKTGRGGQGGGQEPQQGGGGGGGEQIPLQGGGGGEEEQQQQPLQGGGGGREQQPQQGGGGGGGEQPQQGGGGGQEPQQGGGGRRRR